MDAKIRNIIENDERYKTFTILDTPEPFNKFFADKDINLVQIHSTEVVGENKILGFCGICKWVNNVLSPLDGDLYNAEMLVLGYDWFKVTENGLTYDALDILVGNDW